MEIQCISVADMRREAQWLLREHWDEVAKNKQIMVLEPDWDKYEQLENSNALVSVGVFTPANMLIGYSVNVLVNHLHYKSLLVCQNDVLYVSKPHRRSRVGLDLIHETEKQAKTRGAQLMLWHAKPKTALDHIMPRIGYDTHETIYSKVL